MVTLLTLITSEKTFRCMMHRIAMLFTPAKASKFSSCMWHHNVRNRPAFGMHLCCCHEHYIACFPFDVHVWVRKHMYCSCAGTKARNVHVHGTKACNVHVHGTTNDLHILGCVSGSFVSHMGYCYPMHLQSFFWEHKYVFYDVSRIRKRKLHDEHHVALHASTCFVSIPSHHKQPVTLTLTTNDLHILGRVRGGPHDSPMWPFCPVASNP